MYIVANLLIHLDKKWIIPDLNRSLRSILYATDFVGVSGRVRFTSGLSRYSDIKVFQWVNKTAQLLGTFLPIERSKSSRPANTGQVLS